MPHKLLRFFQILRGCENWPVALWNRFGLPWRDEHVTYRLRPGATIRVNRGPAELFLLCGVWFDRPYDALPAFVVRNGWTVLDLGAHKGAFSVKTALTGSDTRIVAVEPEPANARYLRANVEANCPSQVEVIEAALSARHGRGRLALADSASNYLLGDGAEGTSTVDVALIDFESVAGRFEGQIDLVKMDIEGGEYEAIGSLSDESLHRSARWVIKCHLWAGRPAIDGAKLVQARFTSAGFETWLVERHQLLYAWR